MSSIILEFDRNPQISEIDRLQSFMESVQRAFNEFEVTFDDMNLEKHPLMSTISRDNQDFKILFNDYGHFKVITANAIEAIKGDFQNLETVYLKAKDAEIEYAKIDMANINQAWVQDLLVQGNFLANDVNAATGSFSKYLTGVNIVGDNIVAGTISTERLVIRDPNSNTGILYELNNGAVDQRNLTDAELKRLTLDGKIITAESITADKINVTDLFAQNITSTGNFNMGGKGALVYNKSDDSLSIRAKSITLGSNSVATTNDVNAVVTLLEGKVAFDDLKGSTTIINGGVIQTGSIKVDRLNADELQARVGTYGYLKANVLESEVGKFGYLKANELSAEVAKLGYATVSNLDAAFGRITTLETQTITADKIDVNSIFAKEINATGKITGAKLYGAYIETGSGKVGGFSIGSTYIALGTTGFKTTDNSIYIGTDGISLGKTFGVTKAGALTATGVDISGKITANSGSFTGTITANDGGNIGGFTIKKGSYIAYNTSSLAGADNSVYIGTNGISLGTKFKVDTNGKVTATDGVFNGEITANKLTITEGATISGLYFDKLVGSQDVKTSIGNAANTAKHFLEWDGTNGLQVGNKQNGSWVGTRARIAPTSYDILDASGNPVSRFGSKIIDLGIAASDARINLCGGAGYIKAEADGSVWSKILLHAKTLSLQSTGNAVGGVKLLAKSTSNYVASFDLIAASSEAATFATLEVAGKTYTFGAGNSGFMVPVNISAPSIKLSEGVITGAGTRPTYNGSSLALTRDISDIRCGSYGMGVSIAAGSYRDITHSFSPAFASEPNVVATLFSDGTAAALGNVEVAIVSKSASQVKFRIYNNSGAARSPGLTWMAMC